MIRRWMVVPFLVGSLAGGARAEAQQGLRWDAFADAYYAYDFNQPPGGARSFATQPARHNEFNLNLAMVRARYDTERLRGVVALAVGTYMESNYAAEPDHFRHLLEASAGYNLGGSTWLDAGVLPSHIGLESAISAANWTYTRSLAAEYSPYYETGVRLSFQPSTRVSGALLVGNGWQNIRETNDGKAAGLQLQLRPTDRVLLNYSNYLGDEAPSGADERLLRFFNDFYVQVTATDRLGLAAVFDVGTQQREDEDATWWNATGIARVTLSDAWALALRGEYFSDPDQAVVSTGEDEGFETATGSLGLDFFPVTNVLLRAEGRLFSSKDTVWPSDTVLKKRNAFLVTSIAVTF
jgi:hypothetical protein